MVKGLVQALEATWRNPPSAGLRKSRLPTPDVLPPWDMGNQLRLRRLCSTDASIELLTAIRLSNLVGVVHRTCSPRSANNRESVLITGASEWAARTLPSTLRVRKMAECWLKFRNKRVFRRYGTERNRRRGSTSKPEWRLCLQARYHSPPRRQPMGLQDAYRRGWPPSSPTSMPLAIVSARFLVRHVRCLEASAATQAFNLGHMNGDFSGEWAVVVSSKFGVTDKQQEE
jgi:hypothetical protein